MVVSTEGISVDANVCSGKPVIRGTRILVTRDDVQAALETVGEKG